MNLPSEPVLVNAEHCRKSASSSMYRYVPGPGCIGEREVNPHAR